MILDFWDFRFGRSKREILRLRLIMTEKKFRRTENRLRMTERKCRRTEKERTIIRLVKEQFL